MFCYCIHKTSERFYPYDEYFLALSIVLLYVENHQASMWSRTSRTFRSITYALLRFNKTAKKWQVVQNCLSLKIPTISQFWPILHHLEYKKNISEWNADACAFVLCALLSQLVQLSQSAFTECDNPQSFTKSESFFVQLMLQAQLLLLLYQLPSTPADFCVFSFFFCSVANLQEVLVWSSVAS